MSAEVIQPDPRMEPSIGAAPRVALIVLGMHRSGTSALARVLNLLGGDLSREVMPADAHNARGYWESQAIADLDERILGAAGLAWNSWDALDPAWLAGPAVAAFGAEAAALVAEQFGRSPLLILKDPRICRLLPFWRAVLAEAGIAPRVVMIARAPTEVASSLLRRNGANGSLAQLVWLRYVLDAERHSRDLPRACLRYDDLLGDWRGAVARIGAALALDWPVDPADAARAIDAFLAPELRRHRSTDPARISVVDFSPWVRATWAILSGSAEGGDEAGDRARLDAIRDALDAAQPNFQQVIWEHAHHGIALHGELERLRGGIDARIAELEAALAAANDAARRRELLFGEARRVIGLQRDEYDRLDQGARLLRRLVAGGGAAMAAD